MAALRGHNIGDTTKMMLDKVAHISRLVGAYLKGKRKKASFQNLILYKIIRSG